jgi:outer membrane protein
MGLYFQFLLTTSLIFTSCVHALADQSHSKVTNSPPGYLNLRDVVVAGLKRATQIKISEAELRASEARSKEAWSSLYPKIDAKGSLAPNEDEDLQNRAYLSATQPLYTGGALRAGLNYTKNDIEDKRTALWLSQQDTIYSLLASYFQLSERIRVHEAALENLEQLRRHYKYQQENEKIGRTRRVDRLQTQVNLRSAEAESESLKTEIFKAREALRELLLLDEPPLISVMGRDSLIQNSYALFLKNIGLSVTTSTLQPEQINTIVKNALQSSPELKREKLALDQIEQQKKLALASENPSVSLQGQWGYRNADRADLWTESSRYDSATLEVTIPLFSGLSSIAKKRQYAEQKVQQTRALEQIQIGFEAQVRQELENLSSLQTQLQMYQSAQKEAQGASVLARQEYARGLLTSQDLLSIQRTRFEADRNLITTEYATALSLARLHRLMNTDLREVYTR